MRSPKFEGPIQGITPNTAKRKKGEFANVKKTRQDPGTANDQLQKPQSSISCAVEERTQVEKRVRRKIFPNRQSSIGKCCGRVECSDI
jgi:hypothetical protein